MHQSVMDWVGRLAEHVAYGEVLEVGALDVNGSVRGLFSGSEYIGVDMRDGPSVDVVAWAHDLPFEDERFGLVISTEMLEHDAQFWRSLPEMGRVLRPDGWMLLTMRGNGFPEHAYPDDFWRFMPSSARVLMGLANCTLAAWMNDPEQPGIFCAGQKA